MSGIGPYTGPRGGTVRITEDEFEVTIDTASSGETEMLALDPDNRLNGTEIYHLDESTARVINYARGHENRWGDKPAEYWFARLSQEVGELGSALVGDHEDPPEHELRQIASITLNMLRRIETGSMRDSF